MRHLGIDIGSTTVKIAIIDEENNILYSEYQRHFAKIKETLRELLENAIKSIGDMEVAADITGSGGLALSNVIGVPFEQEVVCVSTALKTFAPKTQVAIELGGEDAKIIYFSKNGIEQSWNFLHVRSGKMITLPFITEILNFLSISVLRFNHSLSRGFNLIGVSLALGGLSLLFG